MYITARVSRSQNITESADMTPWYQSFLFPLLPLWAINNWQASYLHHLHESLLYISTTGSKRKYCRDEERYKMMSVWCKCIKWFIPSDLPNSYITLNLGSFLYRRWSLISPAWVSYFPHLPMHEIAKGPSRNDVTGGQSYRIHTAVPKPHWVSQKETWLV